MKTLILNLFLLLQLMVAPLTMADPDHLSRHYSGESQQQPSHIDSALLCSEVISETSESIQKSARHNLPSQRFETVFDNTHKQPDYDFVLDHHKCDWIIRSSEPDP